MSMMVWKILDRVTLTQDSVADLSGALDLGEYRELHLVVTVHSATDGQTPKLCVRHAAVNAEGAYVDFASVCEASLSTPGVSWFPATAFTRYVCWFLSGTLGGEVIVSLDLIAKR